MQYIIRFDKKSNTISLTTEHEEFIPRLTELLEDYKECVIRDIHVSFTVDEMNKTVLCEELSLNQKATLTYIELSPEKVFTWFHNVCAMLENVTYTETVICYDASNPKYDMFDEIVRNQLNKTSV